MKHAVFIPPVIVLAFVASVLGVQQHSISNAENENRRLRSQLDTAESVRHSAVLLPTKGDDKPINWKSLSRQISEMEHSGGTGDPRPLSRFSYHLKSMSKEELIAAIEEIAALDLLGPARSVIDTLLTDELIKRDPVLVLTRFPERLQSVDGTVNDHYSFLLGEWAGDDLISATAWLDSQISSGTFDGKALGGPEWARLSFEGALIGVLYSVDFQAASRRLEAIPAAGRHVVLESHGFNGLEEKDQMAFATMVRANLSIDRSNWILSQRASEFVSDNGFSNVSGFLDRIAATPTERRNCAEKAAESRLSRISDQRKVTREDIDSVREWLNTQTPGTSQRVMGTLLGGLVSLGCTGLHPLDFTEASAHALYCHETSGTDETLSSFLKCGVSGASKEQARILAQKLTDEKLRREVLKESE